MLVNLQWPKRKESVNDVGARYQEGQIVSKLPSPVAWVTRIIVVIALERYLIRHSGI